LMTAPIALGESPRTSSRTAPWLSQPRSSSPLLAPTSMPRSKPTRIVSSRCC
jgi:hypothetical protein